VRQIPSGPGNGQAFPTGIDHNIDLVHGQSSQGTQNKEREGMESKQKRKKNKQKIKSAGKDRQERKARLLPGWLDQSDIMFLYHECSFITDLCLGSLTPFGMCPPTFLGYCAKHGAGGRDDQPSVANDQDETVTEVPLTIVRLKIKQNFDKGQSLSC
jgi:hypothetical protein